MKYTILIILAMFCLQGCALGKYFDKEGLQNDIENSINQVEDSINNMKINELEKVNQQLESIQTDINNRIKKLEGE